MHLSSSVHLYAKQFIGHARVRNEDSPWANMGPHAPPSWSSVGGIIVFRGPIGVRIEMLPEKKLGLTTYGGHFSKWPPQNLLSPISRVLVHVGSWFWCLVLHFLRLGIRWKHSWACQTIATCLDLKKCNNSKMNTKIEVFFFANHSKLPSTAEWKGYLGCLHLHFNEKWPSLWRWYIR